MKFKVLRLSAASIALLASPGMAATPSTPAAEEMTLHIEAVGSIMADYAVITQDYETAGRGRPAAEAAVKAQVAVLKARLLKAGIPDSAIVLTPPVLEEQKPDLDVSPVNRFGFAEAVALEKPAEYGAADPEDAADSVEAVDAGPAEGADAAAQAAYAAAKDAEAAHRQVRKVKKLPIWNARFTATIRVDDLSRYAAAADASGTASYGPMNRADGQFRFNSPETVHARAIAQAMLKARAEADAYSKASGAHVVRMTRVSNTESPVTVAEMVKVFSTMDDRSGRWKIAATHSASIAVDYVIAAD